MFRLLKFLIYDPLISTLSLWQAWVSHSPSSSYHKTFVFLFSPLDQPHVERSTHQKDSRTITSLGGAKYGVLGNVPLKAVDIWLERWFYCSPAENLTRKHKKPAKLAWFLKIGFTIEKNFTTSSANFNPLLWSDVTDQQPIASTIQVITACFLTFISFTAWGRRIHHHLASCRPFFFLEVTRLEASRSIVTVDIYRL